MRELDIIFNRRSIRRYTDKRIEDEKIELLLMAAMYAPSAVNKQPWHFIVIDDRNLMHDITEIHPHPAILKGASHIKPFALVSLGYPAEEKSRPERSHPERVYLNIWGNSYKSL